MPKFNCSYAYDIACFADFVVEAKTEAHAQRIIRKALREQKFDDVECEVCWENGPTHHRVFVSGEAGEWSTSTTLEELVATIAHPPLKITVL